MFIQIERDILKEVYQDHPKTILYLSRIPVIRMIFWNRLKTIFRMMRHADHSKATVLDFGGGNGVFLPSLSRLFNEALCIDWDTQRASKIAEKFNLTNVRIIKSDITNYTSIQNKFDSIVAADVLEHFQDLSKPVHSIRHWLKNGGHLYTSLPTENYAYVLLRGLFRFKKPEDHYHTAYKVEEYLSSQGFVRIQSRHVPLRIFPLFLITQWKKGKTN